MVSGLLVCYHQVVNEYSEVDGRFVTLEKGMLPSDWNGDGCYAEHEYVLQQEDVYILLW